MKIVKTYKTYIIRALCIHLWDSNTNVGTAKSLGFSVA